MLWNCSTGDMLPPIQCKSLKLKFFFSAHAYVPTVVESFCYATPHKMQCWKLDHVGIAFHRLGKKSEKMRIRKKNILFVEKFNKKYDIYDFWTRKKNVHGSKRDLYFCMCFLGAHAACTRTLNTSRPNYGNECLKSNQR